jgi:hypothetical protein
MPKVELGAAERRALSIVESGDGKVSWYVIARRIAPPEFPDEDTNPVRILARLEELGLIKKISGGGKMQWFAVTPSGKALLPQRAELRLSAG